MQFRRGNKKITRVDRRAARPTLYGNPKEVIAVEQPIITDPNLTPYGAKRFRTPTHKNEFSGEQGSALPAVILDIDGTLQTWGQGADSKVLEYCKKHYDAGHVLIVVTARTHDYDYERSFNWLMRNLPYPFIGPFHRACDDPRYASEFKREVAQGFEDMNLYRIVGAADDNDFVNDMWRHWAKEHFDKPEDFDLLVCGYGDYSHWRSNLPSKGAATAWKPSTTTTSTKGRVWVPGAFDSETKLWVQGHYADEPADDADLDGPEWQEYLDRKYGPVVTVASTQPERGDDEFDDLILLDNADRLAMEDRVVAANPQLSLRDVEKLGDAQLMALDGTEADERDERINNRLDLEDEVFAAYPDLSLVEIQDMDVATLQQLFDNRPAETDAPIGGVA